MWEKRWGCEFPKKKGLSRAVAHGRSHPLEPPGTLEEACAVPRGIRLNPSATRQQWRGHPSGATGIHLSVIVRVVRACRSRSPRRASAPVTIDAGGCRPPLANGDNGGALGRDTPSPMVLSDPGCWVVDLALGKE